MNPKRNGAAVSPARQAAFDILSNVEKEAAYASVRIAGLYESDLSREDRALAQEVVLGVLRWKMLLDYLIELYSDRTVDRLDLPVVIALRIGLYQLRYLSRVPQSAAVNESVNLVKRARVASAAPFVNAILRKAARRTHEAAGREVADPLERASIELSHPQWLLKRWQTAFGEEETRLLAIANNTPPRNSFRVNTRRTSIKQVITDLEQEGLVVRKSQLAPGAFVVTSGSASLLVSAADRGLIYFQDEASQLVSILLEPGSGHRVLDLCAAPGSKTSHIADLADDTAWIIACDRYHHRLTTLHATCARLGVGSIDAVALDATRELPFYGHLEFDRVLVDAPCSGTGTLRGNPEIKWRLTPDDLTRLPELQLTLLERGASTVARGGRLVYSTCSLEQEENEEVVRLFLERSTFTVVHPKAPTGVVTSEGFVRTFPHRDGSDGFFAAVLERPR